VDQVSSFRQSWINRGSGNVASVEAGLTVDQVDSRRSWISRGSGNVASAEAGLTVDQVT
jgi:hypothetical protein